MDERRNPPSGPKTLGTHFRKAFREAHAWRPTSFYLLWAIPVVLVLAAPVFYVRDDPKRFALHLALVFIFLFVITWRAIMDCVEIVRRHHAEHQAAFRKALGEEDGGTALGKRTDAGSSG